MSSIKKKRICKNAFAEDFICHNAKKMAHMKHHVRHL